MKSRSEQPAPEPSPHPTDNPWPGKGEVKGKVSRHEELMGGWGELKRKREQGAPKNTLPPGRDPGSKPSAGKWGSIRVSLSCFHVEEETVTRSWGRKVCACACACISWKELRFRALERKHRLPGEVVGRD